MSLPLDDVPKQRPPCADPATVIWRYMGVPRFETLIHDQSLSFHQFKKLQDADQREGMIPDGFWEDTQQAEQEWKEKIDRHREDQLGFAYANCWNMGGCENSLMWKAYAPQGVAIRTTVGKLTGAAITKVMETDFKGNDAPKIEQLTIEYADDWSELEVKDYHKDPPPLVLFLHLKRRAFACEAEVRFRILPHPEFRRQPDGTVSAKREDCPEWCPVKFKALDWIDEVVTAPSMKAEAAESIDRLARERGLNFRHSALSFREPGPLNQ
jgi:hypothetical protein